MLITNNRELFDFAVNFLEAYEKVRNTGVTVISMHMPESNLKYSVRLRRDIPELIRVNDQREIAINPLIAGMLAPQLVVHAIIWAHMRPDFPDGKAGDIETDQAALEVITNYYPGFDKETFITQLDNLCNKAGKNDDRVRAAKEYLDTLRVK